MFDLFITGLHHVPLLKCFVHTFSMNHGYVIVQQTCAIQFTQYCHHTAGAMHIFHVILLRGGCYLAQVGHLAAEPIDVVHGKGHLTLLCGRQ